MSFCYGTKQIWCNVRTGRCWHILPTLQISPHVIIGCLHVKEHLRGKQFELEDITNTAVTDSSHFLSKDEHGSAN